MSSEQEDYYFVNNVAAGTFIVQQAGGKVSDYSGGNDYIFGKELLAGNGRMNEELRGVILEHLFDKRNQ